MQYMARKPLSVRLDEALLGRVKAEASVRGQKVTTFVERALLTALDLGELQALDREIGSAKVPPSATPSTAKELQALKNIAEQAGIPEPTPILDATSPDPSTGTGKASRPMVSVPGVQKGTANLKKGPPPPSQTWAR